ncbi:MAG: GNAT family acetyltransferase [Gammaproteobacteria bacterium]|nr:GNAT family acetyltransferase [Gammaproteobacteria bacterium]
MEIRKFTDADSDQLKALWRLTLPDEAPYNQPDYSLAAKLAFDDMIFVAAGGGTLLGSVMAGYDGHRGWLYCVCVAPEYRRRGLGGQLVQHALAALTHKGCAKVNIQIREDNQAAAGFYATLGFAVEARISMGIQLPQPLR